LKKTFRTNTQAYFNPAVSEQKVFYRRHRSFSAADEVVGVAVRRVEDDAVAQVEPDVKVIKLFMEATYKCQ
jgi:hypothetical protein